MKKIDFSYSATDGKLIHASKWEPDSGITAKGLIQFIHGMAEHRHRYDDAADFFSKAGYICFAEDHRGHGETASGPDERAFFAEKDGWNTVVNDIRILSEQISGNHPDLPLILLGHSMGTALARTYMIQSPERLKMVILTGTAAVKSSTLLTGKIACGLEIIFKGNRVESPLLNQVSFGSFNNCFKPNRTISDWLSRDEAEVDKCIADPLVGFICTTGFFRDLLHGLKYINKPANANKIPEDLPVILISGENDPVGNMGKGVRQVYQSLLRAGIKDVQMKLYPGARHEVMHELNRDRVFREMLEWIENRL
ncbi:MAG: lysophospholipase [Spirochaetales bacterium]|nr:lysophospholipase [Spirochaetales bacterium]